MILPVDAIGYGYYRTYDAEYMRILRELQRLGITSSGNREVDKGRLKRAKEESEFAQNMVIYDFLDEREYGERAELEGSRIGASTVAEINKVLLGL